MGQSFGGFGVYAMWEVARELSGGTAVERER